MFPDDSGVFFLILGASVPSTPRPRVLVVGLPARATVDTIRATLVASSHTRYVVYDGDLDHVIGMVHIKDLLRLCVFRQPFDATKVRPLPVVPETAPLDDVLATMRPRLLELNLGDEEAWEIGLTCGGTIEVFDASNPDAPGFTTFINLTDRTRASGEPSTLPSSSR